jgi:hypothetical protein
MDLEESTSENVAASWISRSMDIKSTPMKRSLQTLDETSYRYEHSPIRPTISASPDMRHIERSFISPPQHLDTAESVNVSQIYRSGGNESSIFRSFLSTTRGSHIFPKGSYESLAQKVKKYQAESGTAREQLKEKLIKLEEEISNKNPTVRLEVPDRYETTEVKDWKSKLPFDLSFLGAVKAERIDEHEIELNVRKPMLKWCGFCRADRSTEVVFETSSKTFWSSVAIFFLGGMFGCFMLPYYSARCKDPKLICHVCKHGV